MALEAAESSWTGDTTLEDRSVTASEGEDMSPKKSWNMEYIFSIEYSKGPSYTIRIGKQWKENKRKEQTS